MRFVLFDARKMAGSKCILLKRAETNLTKPNKPHKPFAQHRRGSEKKGARLNVSFTLLKKAPPLFDVLRVALQFTTKNWQGIMHPKHKPNDETRAKVQALCCVGVTQEMIARVLEISRPTLEKYYRDELDLAVAKANGSIANALYQQAISGNVTAMIFWLKTRARWREKDDSPATPWADAAEEVRKDAETARELLEYIKYGEGAAGSKKPS